MAGEGGWVDSQRQVTASNRAVGGSMSPRNVAVCNKWTGLLDWTTGLVQF